MKIGARIGLIICFFVALIGFVWVSSIQTADPHVQQTGAQVQKTNKDETNIKTKANAQKAERPTQEPTQAVSSQFSEKQLKSIEKTINSRLENMNFNGTFLVAIGDEVIYHKAMGYSDAEKETPNTLDTKYEIGSCTKQFTAAAIAKLAQEGKLSLKDKFTKYVKDVKIGKDVTIEHLINMCSGLPDYLNEYIYAVESGERDDDSTLLRKEFIKWLNDSEMIFTQGEYFSYCNTNYYLLGIIIEEVSGESYEDYIKNEIFYPLYMDDSSLKMTDTNCKGYLDNDWTDGIKIDSSYFYSAGEIVSTTTDMLRWVNAYTKGNVLNSDMFNKATHAGSDGFSYGFGWFVNEDYVYHTGNTELFYAVDIFTRVDDIKIIGLSNVNDTTLQPTALTILKDVEEEFYPENHCEKTTEEETKPAKATE